MPVVRLNSSKHYLAERTYGFDFADLLASGETLSGTPTVTITPAGELVASAVQVNAVDFVDEDGVTTIPAGNGVVLLLSGGESGTSYDVDIACGIAGKSEVAAREFHIDVIG